VGWLAPRGTPLTWHVIGAANGSRAHAQTQACYTHTHTRAHARARPSADLQLAPVKALVSNVASVSCGADFTVWLTKAGEVRLVAALAVGR
jgi:hypothetical protein